MVPRPSPQGYGSGRRSLRIVTQNCYGLPFTYRFPRFEAIAKRLEGLHADLIFLQEVFFPGDEKKFHLPGYHAAWVPKPGLHRGGLLTLSRAPLENIRFHPFRQQGNLHTLQLSDRLLGKGWLEAFLPDWGLTVFNTHLVSTYQERLFTWDGVQESQLVQLMDRMDKSDRAILGGDFNFMSGTPYHRLLAKSLEDVSQGMPDSGAEGFQPKIDHILVKGLGWTDATCRQIVPRMVPGPKGPLPWSDHSMIRVDLALTPNESDGYPVFIPKSAEASAPWNDRKALVSNGPM